jgi:hypothetical protein
MKKSNYKIYNAQIIPVNFIHKKQIEEESVRSKLRSEILIMHYLQNEFATITNMAEVTIIATIKYIAGFIN